jgi:uncharacterized protein (DUF1499 family)
MRYNQPMRKADRRWIPSLALLVAGIAVLLLALAGPAYRAGWVNLTTALQRMIAWGAFAGVAAVTLGLVGLVFCRGRGRALALVALLIGAACVAVPLRLQQAAGRVPSIHDITTDTVAPPVFVEAAAVRATLGVPNTLEYSEDVASRQIAGYPDIIPLFLDVPSAEAYRRALALVEARGWEQLAADDEAHRIEATATTRWFGFKDDVVIRISRLPDRSSRVDMRSVSRVGRSDIGTNARRIREFLADLQRQP